MAPTWDDDNDEKGALGEEDEPDAVETATLASPCCRTSRHLRSQTQEIFQMARVLNLTRGRMIELHETLHFTGNEKQKQGIIVHVLII